ncbi:MAG: hypothetical protein HYX69_02065 [Planctomycetia bacterium]|nr:hypothetical protein [Planctomycetia bacterium]
MAVETPALIAVVGAGPIGLEAALYGRYLGYDVMVYERGRVGENLWRQGDTRLAEPWRRLMSPLGLAALAAQDPRWQPPGGDSLPTAAELVAAYLVPLAQGDLLVDSVRTETEVVTIERDREPGEPPAGADEVEGFRLRVRDSAAELMERADVVIDASGVPSGQADSHWFATGEPDFYVLGEKSAADPGRFSIRDGLAQIRDLFAIIGDRATLDLYASIGGLG